MQKKLLYHKKKQKIIHRVAVPLAAVLCCGIGGTDALAAPCGPGRLLPVNTWLMTAPSCDPAAPTDFVSQYGDDLSGGTYGTDWISFRWNSDPSVQNYVQQSETDSPALGIGNWLYSTNATGTLFLDGTATTTEPCSNYGSSDPKAAPDLLGNCFAIDLTPSSSNNIWQMVGNPFPYTVDWRNVRVASYDGSVWTQYTPSQALTANLMDKRFWYWNGSSYQTKDDSTNAMIGALKPQESVWVRIKSGSSGLNGFKLLIPKRELNDTGITQGGNYSSGNNADCTGEEIGTQDCSNGPDDADMTGNTDADGHAGFSYTKLDSSGNPLPDQTVSYATTPWACVQDNVTGLIWEVKTDNTPSDLHDKDDTYTWYNTDSTTNGGANGEENSTGNTCFGWISGTATTYCNTEAYVNRVNTAGLCGASDWRMPTIKELEGLANLDQDSPAIDTNYFPNTDSSYVWSGSPYANLSDFAWYVHFHFGNSNALNRSNGYAVRLVRGGQ